MNSALTVHAGASFFYTPGTLPYEAQEVRAFGLFLTDMLARMEGAEKAGSVRADLEDIAAGALHKAPLSRPSFEAIAARCRRLTKVLHVPTRMSCHASQSDVCILELCKVNKAMQTIQQ